MKILIVIDSLGAGGAEISTEIICDYMAEKEVYFEILCLDKKSVGVQDRMLAKGYKINFIKRGSFLFEARQIINQIKGGKYDLVHSILSRSNFRTRFARFFVKFTHLESLVSMPYVSERFADPAINSFKLNCVRLIDKYTSLYFVDHFHSVTEGVKKFYCKEFGLKEDIVHVVHRGRKSVEFNRFNQLKENSEVFKLVNVARHEYNKGIIHLLEALKILLDQGNYVKISILGREGPETKRIKEYIALHQLENSVDLVGFTDLVYDYLIDADLFVFPSMLEGTAGVLIEAQAVGLPIACSDIEALKDLVVDGYNAKLFKATDASSIADAIRFFMINPEITKIYGENSIKRFNENFLLEVNNEKMYKLYLSLCSK